MSYYEEEDWNDYYGGNYDLYNYLSGQYGFFNWGGNTFQTPTYVNYVPSVRGYDPNVSDTSSYRPRNYWDWGDDPKGYGYWRGLEDMAAGKKAIAREADYRQRAFGLEDSWGYWTGGGTKYRYIGGGYDDPSVHKYDPTWKPSGGAYTSYVEPRMWVRGYRPRQGVSGRREY